MANEIYKGVVTWNTIKLYANGSKKRFEGFIVIKDTNGNETSYKMVSFRSQVIIQGETLGEKGMSGKSCTAHGEFKENTWNGNTTWQFMCDKLILDGMEDLANQAEKAATPLPAVPAGTLPSNPMQPMQVAAVAPTTQNMVAPVVVAPPPVIGAVPIQQTIAPVTNMPPPVIGAVPIQQTIAPVAAPVYQAPQIPVVSQQPVVMTPVPATPLPKVKLLPETEGEIYYDIDEDIQLIKEEA